MLFRAAADLVLVAHAAFVVFVLLGGLLVARRPQMAWLHLPAAAWGVVVELARGICPLTPLENYLRERAGLAAYQGDFVEHYLLPVLYPARLTPVLQIWLGVLAIVVNLCVYLYVLRAARTASGSRWR